LAIAAAKLGSSHVLGIDNDRIAIRVAKENAALNKVSVRFRVDLVEKVVIQRKYELVIANLFSELLIRNSKKLTSWMSCDGTLILSGVRLDQVSEVKKAFSQLTLKRERKAGKWCCLVFRR
jgi:ribosomal protein L11 methyltransferase